MKIAIAVLACLVLAAPAATARPVEQFLDPASSCDKQWESTYHTPAPPSCEQQVLASHGTGAPDRPAATASIAPSLPSGESGFDWGSAAVGAFGAAGLLALVGFGVPAVWSRRRIRTAQP